MHSKIVPSDWAAMYEAFSWPEVRLTRFYVFIVRILYTRNSPFKPPPQGIDKINSLELVTKASVE
jgi:hypothetical protein